MDRNNSGYINNTDFTDGLLTLFTETFEKLAKFIFKLYDYDKDGKINREDIRIVLSYIPINTVCKVSKAMAFDKGDFKDRVESQEEMDSIIEAVFEKKTYIDEKEFIYQIENVKSEFFIYVSITINKIMQ